ncbi:pantoate--beta-alanine ligase [Helicobacter valdiviensis]|uniref:Pantothenate synthetase n=1 Tax=Helicobacter valdiviensis TaxID=1458358 RepID=A0A2W6NF43_9HELI|nr:pantoate--beta-alanine ligase [Helicobacter valdiviensis]PZT47610.1 pantoate--beta-alanine ligase [Helicobacter valdiviensis]
MLVFTKRKELQDFIKDYKVKNPTNLIGLVPTMGALHNGHLSLIEACIKECNLSIVSIFVNPTQFGANEDFSKYPRKEEADLNVCQKAGVDIVFMPKIEEVYPLKEEFQTTFNAPQSMVNVLEGKVRPGHFNGVLQVVSKLFFLTQANKAFFGKKDAQQLLIIQKMVEDLFLPIEIVPCPIVRSNEGLALSSRNVYLSDEGRKEALKISNSLNVAMRLIMQGEIESEKIIEAGLKALEGLEVEYFVIVDRSLQNQAKIQKDSTLILVVARVEGVRLLDNLWI